MNRRWVRWLIWVLVLAATATIISRVDVGRILAACRTASWQWIGVVAAANLLSVFVDALRWRAVLMGIRRVDVASVVEGFLLGWLSNSVLPLKMGEGAKAWALSRRERLPIATVLSTVFLDRAVDVAGFGVLLVVVSVLTPLPPSALAVRAYGLGGLAALAALAVIAVFARRWIGAGIRNARLDGGALSRVLDGLSVLGHQRRLASVVGISALAWASRVAVVWCAMRAFHLDLPPIAAAAVLVTLNIGIAAVAVPANLGVFEIAIAAGLALFEVPGEVGLSVGMVLHAAELVPTVALALIVQAVAPSPRDAPP